MPDSRFPIHVEGFARIREKVAVALDAPPEVEINDIHVVAETTSVGSTMYLGKGGLVTAVDEKTAQNVKQKYYHGIIEKEEIS